ncbi:MAG: hypothetical protein ACOYZ6_09465 [Chloroflexota bacterium]
MNMDCEVSLKSLLFVADGLEQLIGQHGAQAVLRSAGQRASANLIEMLPLTLSEDEAARRSGMMLVELGFLNGLELSAAGELRVTGNHVMEEMQNVSLDAKSVRFYVVGLFEGFYKQMSGSKKKVVSVEPGADFEIWRLE